MAESRINSVDQRVRTLSVVLEPAFVLARMLGMSLDDLQALVATGYFREYRRRGLSIPQVARYLGKSERTVATLSKRSAEAGALLDQSRRVQLQRELIRTGSVGVVSRRAALRISPTLDEEEVDVVLDQMEEEGLLASVEGGWVTVAEHIDMVSDEFDKRLDSLRHFLSTITRVVHGRFFGRRPADSSLARVWTFSTTTDALQELATSETQRLRERAIEIDAQEAPNKHSGSIAIAVVEHSDDIVWAPGRRR